MAMIFWYFYVLCVAALSLAGYITVNILATGLLAFAVHLLFHWFAFKSRFLTALKVIPVAALAAAVLWRQSWLPPFATLRTFLSSPETRPSTAYLVEFARQSVNPHMVAAGVGLLAFAVLVSWKKPILLPLLSYPVLLGAWIAQPPREDSSFRSDSLAAFYEKESHIHVQFPSVKKDPVTFAIIILHVCSLSWEDMRVAGIDPSAFFSRFDYVFTDFSAATAYSGPSVLRVMRSACGQSAHSSLYSPADAGCYLFDDLRSAGYDVHTLMDHDGRYDGFAATAKRLGHAPWPVSNAALPVKRRMFDGSPLVDDGAVLDRYWKTRMASGQPRSALYYNTVVLHVGVRDEGRRRDADDVAAYRQRLAALLAETDKFMEKVGASGRRAVVVFLPEHGAALVGSKLQLKDVRNIPLPGITTVPVGVKLIGMPPSAPHKPEVVAKTTSHRSIAWLLAEFMRNSPFEGKGYSPERIAAHIPQTEFVSENETGAVMRSGFGYMYRAAGKDWQALPAYVSLQPGVIPSAGEIIAAAGE